MIFWSVTPCWLVTTSSCSMPYLSQGKFLEPLSLHDVRLLPGTPAWDAQQTNLEYLLMLDVDRMMWNFRKVAAESAGPEDEPEGEPYGGWENPGSELRGHFVGE